MERTIYNKILIGFYKAFGVFLSLVSLILFIQYLGVLLDPEAMIKVNGVPSNRIGIKIFAVVFAVSFIILGLLLSFSSYKTLEKIFIPKFLRYKKSV